MLCCLPSARSVRAADREILVCREELCLPAIPFGIGAELPVRGELSPQRLVARQEIVPSQHIQIRIRHNRFQAVARRLRHPGGQDDALYAGDMLSGVAKGGQHVRHDRRTHGFVSGALLHKAEIVEAGRRSHHEQGVSADTLQHGKLFSCRKHIVAGMDDRVIGQRRQ